jgi:ABC-type lipoprotein release transport system permease subunit
MKNLLGAGLRTWLNAIILGVAMVIIILLQGIYQGFEEAMKSARIADEVGKGQYQHDSYDALDPLTFDKSHAPIPVKLESMIRRSLATPILVTTATIYPQGRMQNVTLRGILPGQKVLGLPTQRLGVHQEEIPLMMGRRMAQQLGMGEGDTITVRFKTAQGAFDARDFIVAAVFTTEVPAVDLGQLWVALPALETMLGLTNEATMIVLADQHVSGDVPGFRFKSQDELMQDTTMLIRQKQKNGFIVYTLLIFVAMVSIFDTQVLAVFRRRKEIGLLMALGLTPNFIVGMFTLEGILHGFFAGVLGALVGMPLLSWLGRYGIPLPNMTEKMGLAVKVIYPVFGPDLLLMTFAIIMLILSVVSYLPAKSIAALQPTQALRGS